jgi:transposase
MNSDKYVALDVHSATVVAAVHNAAGKCVMESIIETKAKTIRDFINGITGNLHVGFEQGTHAHWLYDLIKPLVTEVIVCDPRHNKLILSGNKSDRIDANKLAQLLRQGSLRPVYQGESSLRALKELALQYDAIVGDSVRVMNRIKAIYRGRAIACTGKQVYEPSSRQEWLEQLPEAAIRSRAQYLYRQLDCLIPIREEAQEAFLRESQRHSTTKILKGIPSLGPIRAAQIVAIVGTPHRFRTKRQFWAYCGFGIVTRSSADYKIVNGRLERNTKKALTRGLNRNYSRRLKRVFKSAAIHGSTHAFQAYFQQLVGSGIRPEMATLTLARKISAISLAVWKSGEKFDAARLSNGSATALSARRQLKGKSSNNVDINITTGDSKPTTKGKATKRKSS